MSHKSAPPTVSTINIDLGKNSFGVAFASTPRGEGGAGSSLKFKTK
jgi:hypothetical protein